MKPVILLVSLSVGLSACSTVKLNPFASGGDKSEYQTYVCDDKKQFKVKRLDQQKSAWVQTGDHEVYLEQDSSGNGYTNGQYTLTIKDKQVSLTGGDEQYQACQPSP